MKQKNMLRYLDIIINQAGGIKSHIKYLIEIMILSKNKKKRVKKTNY